MSIENPTPAPGPSGGPAPAPVIDISHVSKRFATRSGEVEALRDVSLQVAPKEFITLVGRSGCGKSTLLRLIAGLIVPSDGEVRVAGEKVTGPRADVGMMFQRPALLPWRTVLDNVLLPVEIGSGKAGRASRTEVRDRARSLLSMAGLGGFESKHPHELSGGMQQRVSLCRSLLQRPRVLLMDEPFSALDALTREDLAIELQRIVAEESTTIVFVTHSIDEAVILADRTVVLSPRPGRLQEIVDVPLDRPRTLGRSEDSEEVARISTRLHDLLHPDAAAAAREDVA